MSVETKHDLVLGGNWYQGPYQMVSAQAEGMEKEWHIALGKKHAIWLYHPERSGVWCSGGPGSRGCGGSTVPFKLAGGLGTISLVGPWHSNAGQFLEETGIDVRDQFVTWGCVGTERLYATNTGRSGIGNLIWFDKEPTKGKFQRVEFFAWELQQLYPGQKLYMYSESEGGSTLGQVSEPRELF